MYPNDIVTKRTSIKNSNLFALAELKTSRSRKPLARYSRDTRDRRDSSKSAFSPEIHTPDREETARETERHDGGTTRREDRVANSTPLDPRYISLCRCCIRSTARSQSSPISFSRPIGCRPTHPSSRVSANRAPVCRRIINLSDIYTGRTREGGGRRGDARRPSVSPLKPHGVAPRLNRSLINCSPASWAWRDQFLIISAYATFVRRNAPLRDRTEGRGLLTGAEQQ